MRGDMYRKGSGVHWRKLKRQLEPYELKLEGSE